jgi:uncharacterized protein (DUF433 family)
MPIVPIEHIEIDSRGDAKIVGSRIKVIHLVMAKAADGLTIEQLYEQYPHLTPAQIHAAFAHYYDHKEELDARIVEDARRAKEERDASLADCSMRAKLRQLGKLP